MGKIILLLVILFASYWAVQYYKNTNKKHDPDMDYENFSEDEIDKLINFFDIKIKDIEKKSIDKINQSEKTLSYYKSQLEKLNQIKNKNK